MQQNAFRDLKGVCCLLTEFIRVQLSLSLGGCLLTGLQGRSVLKWWLMNKDGAAVEVHCVLDHGMVRSCPA